MSTHDPRQVIENLRDHLATHDRTLSFLFGAGTSSSVNIAPTALPGQKPTHQPLIPGIEGLTEICYRAVCCIGENQTDAWGKLVCQCEQDSCPANVEDLLSKVRMKIDAIGDGETLVGLDKASLISIERTVCAAIAKTVNPSEDMIPTDMPHDSFASWVKSINRTTPVEIFTTNYDILFERAFEAARVPVFDGFVGTHRPFFYSECLEDEELLPKSKWVRLWKIHGSVNWLLENGTGKGRIIRSSPADTGELILPSHRKYDESRKQPYIAYIDRLSRILNAEHALLITCGYSFGDEHINAVLYGALDNRPTANIIALQFQELKEKDDLVREALRRPNLSVVGPNAAVISANWGHWQLTQPVDRKTCAFMDMGFDSNAMPEDGGSPANRTDDLTGKMRLGDFNWFCRFLKAMGGAFG